MNEKTEIFQKKMSPVSAEIIQMMVAQDTAYGDLKQKLQHLHNNHEKLRQNMMEVQMQRESISGQYQEEMRLRSDVSNKLSSTYELCNVLEECSERLKDTLTRCKTDHMALCEIHQNSKQVVRDIKSEQEKACEKSRMVVADLQEKVKLMSDYKNQLLQDFTTAKHQTDYEIAEMRNKLRSVTGDKDDLINTQNELNRKLDQYKVEMEKKEEINEALNAELKKLVHDFKSQSSEGREVLQKQKNEINEIVEENTALKNALNNQEKFTNTVFEQNKEFQEKIGYLENNHRELGNSIDELKLQLKDAESTQQHLRNTITTVTEEKQSRLDEIQNIKEMIQNLEYEINSLKSEFSDLETEKKNIMAKLNNALEESNNRAIDIEKITSIKARFEEKISQLEDALKTHREATDEKNKELVSVIETIDKEINYRIANIKELTADVKKNTNTISKLNIAVQNEKKEIETEKFVAREKEKKMNDTIEHLETNIKDKDNELSKQIGLINEMKNEKERAKEQIQGLQDKFDNVQKALAVPTSRDYPDISDTAVTHSKNELQSVRQSIRFSPKPAEFSVHPSQDADSYNTLMFSEGSFDGHGFNLSELNRRFSTTAGGCARGHGDQVSSSPFAAFRQSRAASPVLNTLRAPQIHKSKPNNKEPITSFTQKSSNSKNKERKFFKNKRSAVKLK